MMRRAATLAFLLLLALPLTATAETGQDEHPHLSAVRSLTLNRSLLMKAETQYRQLQEQEAHDTTGSISRQLSDLRYKIQAFNEDAERLRGMLPPDAKTDDLLPSVTGPRPVDTSAEKRVEDMAKQIYEMHEKALHSVGSQKFEEAEKIYEEIVFLSPDDDEAYLLLGHVCLAAGHYEKAADAFHNAVHIDPQNAREIPRLYENILLENPSDDEAMTQLGYAHLLLGSAEKARLAFQDALTVNPSNIEARKGLLELP
jgi:tetratricopeptide (TPR) repeat protein